MKLNLSSIALPFLPQTNLTKREIDVVPSTEPVSIAKGGENGYLLTVKSAAGEERVLDVGLVMFATGRKPRTHDLGLESVGVQLDAEGAVKVDEFSRTTVDSVWAVGDATNRINLTPVALMEGMAFAKSCFGGVLTKPDYSNVPSAVFCQPPFASVGYSEAAAVAAFDGDIDVYREEFRPMRNTISGRDEKVLIKVVVHAESDRVLGESYGSDTPFTILPAPAPQSLIFTLSLPHPHLLSNALSHTCARSAHGWP